MGIGEIGELLRRSTVLIRGAHARRPSAGSGVIWNRDGTIVTNAHVLGSQEPTPHEVELWDGRRIPAEVKARDDQRDLALLQLAAPDLAAATFRSSAVKPGELVVAVGNPLGFTGAMTTGVVHAAGPVAGFGRRSWVQAAIRLAPGNSGGPLADASGQVVGINTLFISGITSGGIALAVPAATVEEFVRHGVSARIGVTIQPVSLGQKRWGLLILGVEPGSPAEQASLMMGDVLVGTSTTEFAGPDDLADAIGEARSGRLTIRFLRGDRSRAREVVVALGGRPAREAA